MVGAVRPVLHEISHQDDEEERHPEVQALHPAADAVAGGPAEQLVHQQVGGQQDEAHHHVVHDEVVEIALPLGAEDGLVAPQGEELLDEDEDQGAAQQVEDEPVEADVGRVVREIVHGHLVAAEQRGRGHEQEGCGREPARTVEHDVDEREPAGHHQRGEQHHAQHIDVVGLAELGRGEVFGEVEGEHAQEAQDAERERDDAGDVAAARTQFAVAGGEIVEFVEHGTAAVVCGRGASVANPRPARQPPPGWGRRCARRLSPQRRGGAAGPRGRRCPRRPRARSPAWRRAGSGIPRGFRALRRARGSPAASRGCPCPGSGSRSRRSPASALHGPATGNRAGWRG